MEEINAGKKKIGPVLDGYMADTRPDLFVMGAYGRSRIREFVLGGATEHVLHDPKAASAVTLAVAVLGKTEVTAAKTAGAVTYGTLLVHAP